MTCQPVLGAGPASDGEETRRQSMAETQSKRLSLIMDDATNKQIKDKMRQRRRSSSLSRLKIAGLRLHGREDDMSMLLGKLRDMKNLTMNELIMVTGTSGCGKSSLVMRGISDPAKKMGIAFVSALTLILRKLL